jgi:hypothetical protein
VVKTGKHKAKAAIGTDADGTVCFYLVYGAGAIATSAPTLVVDAAAAWAAMPD